MGYRGLGAGGPIGPNGSRRPPPGVSKTYQNCRYFDRSRFGAISGIFRGSHAWLFNLGGVSEGLFEAAMGVRNDFFRFQSDKKVAQRS